MSRKTTTCKKCGVAGLSWYESYDGRWKLSITENGVIKDHKCEGSNEQDATCKYCGANDLHWYKETMPNGSTKNVLTESYGLPHACDQHKEYRKQQWELLKKQKRDFYDSQKKTLDEMVIKGTLSSSERNKRLYRLRNSIWPGIHDKKKEKTNEQSD